MTTKRLIQAGIDGGWNKAVTKHYDIVEVDDTMIFLRGRGPHIQYDLNTLILDPKFWQAVCRSIDPYCGESIIEKAAQMYMLDMVNALCEGKSISEFIRPLTTKMMNKENYSIKEFTDYPVSKHLKKAGMPQDTLHAWSPAYEISTKKVAYYALRLSKFGKDENSCATYTKGNLSVWVQIYITEKVYRKMSVNELGMFIVEKLESGELKIV